MGRFGPVDFFLIQCITHNYYNLPLAAPAPSEIGFSGYKPAHILEKVPPFFFLRVRAVPVYHLFTQLALYNLSYT